MIILMERVNVGEYMYKFANFSCIQVFVNALEKI